MPDEITPTDADGSTDGPVDELEAAAAAAFATNEPPAAESEPTGESTDDAPVADDDAGIADSGGEDREGVSSPPAAADDDTIQLRDDLGLSREEAIQWAEFGQFLRANPEYAQAIAQVLEGNERPSQQGETAPAEPTVPDTGAITPPPDIDLDDPAIKALWDQHVATLSTIARLEATVQAHDQYVTRSSAETTQSLLNTARATYKEKHSLSDTEMEKVYEVAGRLQVLPALLATTDPVTGVPREVDPLSAMQEAFEIARWNIPELREREMQLKVDEQKSDAKRKQKLSSLSGSSGSVPETQPEPKNAQERRQAMIREVAGMMDEGAN